MQPSTYYGNLFKRAMIDTKNFLGFNVRTAVASVAILGIGFLIHSRLFGYNAALDEIRSWVSFVLIGTGAFSIALFFYNVIRAPYRLAVETEHRTSEREKKAAEIEAYLESLKKGRPLLKIAPAGCCVDTRQFNQHLPAGVYNSQGLPNPVPITITFAASCLHVRIINNPDFSTPEAAARKVSAVIRFYDEQGKELFFIDGRWAESDQPATRPWGVSTIDLLSMDFGIGQTRELDVAFKDSEDVECYGINNDSFRTVGLKYPRFKLEGRIFTAEIRLRGEWIDQTFKVRFRNLGRGAGLEVIE